MEESEVDRLIKKKRKLLEVYERDKGAQMLWRARKGRGPVRLALQRP